MVAWRIGQSDVYAGLEVWHWMEANGKLAAANALWAEIEVLRKRGKW